VANPSRIPFGFAVNDDRLLKSHFFGVPGDDQRSGLSGPQRVLLKTIYGLPLDVNTKDFRGFTEVDYWAASQGYGHYTELGHLQGIDSHPVPQPKHYREAWIVAGRRAGKTSAVASTCVAYEAALGGHEAHIRPGQTALCFLIAQDMRMARNSLGFIRAVLDSSPVMKKLMRGPGTADRIDLKNGITIAVVPPTMKSVRGYACPIAIMDEVGVWYQDAESANPDYEVWRSVKPGQLQFPDALLIGISSPWSKQGLLYSYFEAGTDGCRAHLSERARFADCLVWHGTTAGMGNPAVREEWLRQQRDQDPQAFERECLAVFQDSVSGFLNSTFLRLAVDQGIIERPPQKRAFHMAAADAGFRRDAFGFAIAHADERGMVVLDVLRRWVGTPERPINPRTIFAELVPVMRAYGVTSVATDQYHFESLHQLALEYGFGLEEVTFTGQSKSSIYGDLQMLVNQQRIRLLDDPEALRELRSLERVLSGGGTVQITAPVGQHDDMATVIALCAHRCAWMLAGKEPDTQEPKPMKRQTPQEMIGEYLKAQRARAQQDWDWA
jgi:hypothetical protein